MIVKLCGRQIEDVLLDRFDYLLEKQNDKGVLFDDDNVIEYDMLSTWYGAYLDYGEALNEVLAGYEENGVEFV